ncbi:hypothetical protein [Oryza sativa Japonica Group]|uniref:Uncharacterized protein n=1 Tax=Oryza sativa subsp. japonica TaxID=39947 RepID=Q5ZAK5_ORYSJ|nr:hypothetical protein [Oryza sativa Japonica Group]
MRPRRPAQLNSPSPSKNPRVNPLLACPHHQSPPKLPPALKASTLPLLLGADAAARGRRRPRRSFPAPMPPPAALLPGADAAGRGRRRPRRSSPAPTWPWMLLPVLLLPSADAVRDATGLAAPPRRPSSVPPLVRFLCCPQSSRAF